MGSTRSGSTSSKKDKGASPEAGSKTVPETKAVADSTATGMQIQHESGDQHIPSGKEAGSQVPVVGGDPQPDAIGKGNKPKGLQAEPALFVSNGSISSTDVPTPQGLQPIGAIATSPEHGEQLQAQRKADHQKYVDKTKVHTHKLDEATVGRLHRTELRAIGLQRGYKMPESGHRVTRAAFLDAQSKDSTIGGDVGTKGTSSRGSKGGGKGGSQQASEGVSNKQLGKTTRQTAPTKKSEVNTSRRGGKK